MDEEEVKVLETALEVLEIELTNTDVVEMDERLVSNPLPDEIAKIDADVEIDRNGPLRLVEVALAEGSEAIELDDGEYEPGFFVLLFLCFLVLVLVLRRPVTEKFNDEISVDVVAAKDPGEEDDIVE